MKSILKLPIIGLLSISIVLANTVSVDGQSSQDETQLKGVLSSVNKKLYGLLKLSQRLRQDQAETSVIEKIRIISIGCPLVDDPQSLVPLPDELLQSQEFEILDYQNRYFQIESKDGQVGWVSENCTEKFLEEGLLNSLGVSGRTEYNVINTLAQDTYLRLSEDLDIANKLKKNKIDKLAQSSTEKSRLEALYTKILNKKDIADRLFEKYFSQSILLANDELNILDNLSIQGQLALGSSNFKKTFAKSGPSINKSGNTDFKLQMKYQLDPQNRLSLDVGKRQESLQSVYSNGFAGIGFNRNTNKIQMGINARFNSYDDKFRTINSYKRLNLNANVRQELSEKVDMYYRYNLLNNDFENKKESNYSRHAIELKSRVKTNGTSYVEIGGNADFSNSDLSFFKYKRYKPQIVYYQRKADGGSSKLGAYMEIFDFDITPLRSNTKYYVGIHSTKPSEGNTHTNNSEASLLFRKFPNNSKNEFYQLKLGKGRRVFGSGNKQMSTALITRYFPENPNFSHLDLHMDYQTNSTAYYSFTGNVRYWFPGDQNFITTDLYGKVGLKIQSFSISPTIGIHANTDLKAEEFSLKSDKNNIRGGLEGRGNVLIAKLIRWNFRAAYEYGFVYNAKVETFGDLGEILYGEILQRNPHSLQIQSDVSAQIFKKTEVYGSFRYFTYQTDFVSQLSVSPVVSNNRLSAQLGVRFRYN